MSVRNAEHWTQAIVREAMGPEAGRLRFGGPVTVSQSLRRHYSVIAWRDKAFRGARLRRQQTQLTPSNIPYDTAMFKKWTASVDDPQALAVP